MTCLCVCLSVCLYVCMSRFCFFFYGKIKITIKFQSSIIISMGVMRGQIPPPLPNYDIALYVCHDFTFCLKKQKLLKINF